MPKSSRKSSPCEPTLPSEPEFWEWASHIPIASRDTGYGPIHPWGTQVRLIHEILEGLKVGQRHNIVAKAGQIGASMAMQLLTVFWMLRFPGLQGAVVANEDSVRDYVRDNLVQIVLRAPNSSGIRLNNRNTLALDNDARVLFHTAGPKTGQRLSIGRGFNFLWGTEGALWSGGQTRTVMLTRFSDEHPFRLLVEESTPRGRNHYYDAWVEAEDAVNIRRIELCWWMREDLRLEPDTPAFKHYWNGSLRSYERRWIKEVSRRYGVELEPEQLAWRRQYLSEKAGGDERSANQEMATLIEDGFAATGESFLPYEALRRVRRTVSTAPTPTRWRYEFSANIEDTDLKPTIPSYETLAIWEKPGAVDGYVVAAVPAFSANPEDPEHVLSVWRANRDELAQVVEFADEECGMQNFSWCCQHMRSAYNGPRKTFILELSGMGQGVLQEIKRSEASGWGTRKRPQLVELIGRSANYLYRRPDSFSVGSVMHWKSSAESTLAIMNRFRDQVNSGRVVVRSSGLLEQLERVRQEGDLFKAEGKSPATHRVHAAALAVESWAGQLVPVFQRIQGNSTARTVTARLVENFFNDLRTTPKRATYASSSR